MRVKIINNSMNMSTIEATNGIKIISEYLVNPR